MTRERKANGRTAAMHAAMAGTLALILAACTMPGQTADAAADPEAKAETKSESALGSYLAARHAQQTRDYDQAAAFMGRALEDDPGNADLMRRTFLLRVTAGKLAEALPLARHIADIDRNSTLAQLVLLLEEVKAGDFAAALARARALPNDGAQRLAVPLLVAWCELGAQHQSAALHALDQLNELQSIKTLKELHAALLADVADQVDAATQAYQRLIAGQQQLTWHTVELAGNFFERHQRSEEARRLYERLAAGEQGSDVVRPALARIARGEIPPPVVASPRDGIAEALFDLASILDQRETIDASLVYARLALDLRPDFALAQMLVAEIAESQQHQEEALAIYRAVDVKSPLAWSARLRAAAVLDALGRTDEAAATLNRLAADRPGEPDALIELGDILRGRDRFADAVKAYDEAMSRATHQEPRHWRLYYSRGVALERSGQWARAEADLSHALELQPDQPLVLNYLGYSWIDRGEHLEQALKMIKRAVELRPNDGYIVDSLGWAYYRLGDFGEATKLLEHAIELVPEDPTINDHLGDAYWQNGRVNEARNQWRRALQFKPEAELMKTIEMKLDQGIAKLPAGAATRGG